ncbi:hypothetical protein PMIN05_012658 [Paraphaeosphaeria minitans]
MASEMAQHSTRRSIHHRCCRSATSACSSDKGLSLHALPRMVRVISRRVQNELEESVSNCGPAGCERGHGAGGRSGCCSAGMVDGRGDGSWHGMAWQQAGGRGWKASSKQAGEGGRRAASRRARVEGEQQAGVRACVRAWC